MRLFTNKTHLLLSLCMGLAIACESKAAEPTSEEPAATASEKPAEAPAKAAPVAETTAPTTTPAASAGPPMDEVHAHLRAGKKILAVKTYRELHGKLALNAANIGVQVEAVKLGLPSLETVRNAHFDGKDSELEALMTATYPGSAKTDSQALLLQDIRNMGPATEDNLKAKAAAGESTSALAIYHYLHPEVPIPDAWKVVQTMMGK